MRIIQNQLTISGSDSKEESVMKGQLKHFQNVLREDTAESTA